MSAIERRMAAADQRAHRLLAGLGQELRAARTTRGLSQEELAATTRIDQADISRIERGVRPGVSMAALARLATAVGLDLSIRLFPGGEPIRDASHAMLLARFREAIGEVWMWSAEVPLPIPGDKRAWDRLLRRAGVVIGVEAETKPTDLQELQRRLALKKRDGGVDRLCLVLPNTEWCRRLLRRNDMTATFPVPGEVAMRALCEGRDPGGDAALLV